MRLLFQHKRLLAIAVCMMFVWTSGVWFVLDMQRGYAASFNPDDVAAVRWFLEQEEGGITNADKLEINAEDSNTWGQFFHFNADGRLVLVRRSSGLPNISANLHGEIKFEGCTALEEIWLGENLFTEIDVSQNPELLTLFVRENNLALLDVLANTKLIEVDASFNQLTELDLSNNSALRGLYISDNYLESLDLEGTPLLSDLYASHNKLKTLDLTAQFLQGVDLRHNKLESLDVTSNRLWWLDASHNNLETLDISGLPSLRYLYTYGNSLQNQNINAISARGLEYFAYSKGNVLCVELNMNLPSVNRSIQDSYVKPSNYAELDSSSVWDVTITVEIKMDIIPGYFNVDIMGADDEDIGIYIVFEDEYDRLLQATRDFALKVDGAEPAVLDTYEEDFRWNGTDWMWYELYFETTVSSDQILVQLDFTEPCNVCEDRPCICPCETCGERPCVCPCECGVCLECDPILPCPECEQFECICPCECGMCLVCDPPCACGECDECDPPVFVPKPDLFSVGIKQDGDKVVLTNIDEDFIEEHEITFKWWRRVGDGEWVAIDVPVDQPWVTIELHPEHDVAYKCEIIIDGEHQLERERTFHPPIPQRSFFRNLGLWALAGIFAILGILCIVVALNKHEERQRKRLALKKK